VQFPAHSRPPAPLSGFPGFSRKKGMPTAAAICAAGGTAEFVQLDVRSSPRVAEVIGQPLAGGERVDVLVYCAGVFDNMFGCVNTTEDL
jgi:NAD(P)-dependent dehydrogenase (short-subunit alcohol dehydrogenase family)